MKFTIEKNELLKALTRIIGIADQRGAIPILSNLKIETNSSDSIVISATNLDISFKGEFSAVIDSVGSITANARKLFDIIKELDGERIRFTVDSNNWINIECNHAVFNIPGISSEEFPVTPEFGSSEVVKIGLSALKDAVKKILLSVADKNPRQAFEGAFFEILDNMLTMVSSDGSRLSFVRIDNIIIEPEREGGQGEKRIFIIPKKTLSEILKIEDGEDGDEHVEFFSSDYGVAFKKGKGVLISRIIDAKFPNYGDVIPAKFKYRAVINKSIFYHAIKRVSLLADEESRMIKLDFKKGSLTLISDTSGIGGARESIPISYEGEDIIIAVNASYAIDVLNILSDEIFFDLINNKSPLFIGCPKNLSYKYIIMPMRIKSAAGEEE